MKILAESGRSSTMERIRKILRKRRLNIVMTAAILAVVIAMTTRSMTEELSSKRKIRNTIRNHQVIAVVW